MDNSFFDSIQEHFGKSNTEPGQYSSLALAYIGDGVFDLIITKEISCFARNLLDSIFYTRELKKYGVGVIFINDNINTPDGDSGLRLAIMASIAQEESRKTSERIKWGGKNAEWNKALYLGKVCLAIV